MPYNLFVAAPFHFDQTLPFSPENPEDAEATLRSIPALPGVFALRGHNQTDQPYLTRTADLRRRTRRLLNPPESQSKRLNLRDKVAFIDYTVTGSDFESTLTLYHASAALFGYPEARRRLKLITPFFVRFTAENSYPRVYSTNRLSRRALANFYGPFPSRAAADRYLDAVLDLFKLRRCYEDLAPFPEHPGCVYQEMKKCLAPCNQACTPAGAEAYAAEAAAVQAFLDTHGDSLLAQVAHDRDRASAEMEFEQAAALHLQHLKVKAAATLADDLVQSIPNLRAVILQKTAHKPPQQPTSEPDAPSEQRAGQPDQPAPILNAHPEEAAVFLLHAGCLTGPARLSTLGVRAVKEQTSVGSSLFAQPLMLQAIPLSSPDLSQPDVSASPTTPAPPTPADSPELRAAALLNTLTRQATAGSAAPDTALLSDHLSLLRRWYYRPEKHRTGEIFFPNPDAARDKSTPAPEQTALAPDKSWPIRRILNGAARIVLGDPTPIAESNREAAKSLAKSSKIKVLHAGRPGVERTVPVYNPATSENPVQNENPAGSAANPSPNPPPAEAQNPSESSPAFTSRRSSQSLRYTGPSDPGEPTVQESNSKNRDIET